LSILAPVSEVTLSMCRPGRTWKGNRIQLCWPSTSKG
jgi:hypothetical protein